VYSSIKTVGTSTSYSLTLNSGNTNTALNVDNLKFDYATQRLFVSRACGYKTTFTLDIPILTHIQMASADQNGLNLSRSKKIL
jgi:hypothetical protein